MTEQEATELKAHLLVLGFRHEPDPNSWSVIHSDAWTADKEWSDADGTAVNMFIEIYKEWVNPFKKSDPWRVHIWVVQADDSIADIDRVYQQLSYATHFINNVLKDRRKVLR